MTPQIRQLLAEACGTFLLLATVVGSGIMGEALADGNVAIALLANTLATGAILAVVIGAFGPVSGAHFNPAVTLVFWWRKELALPLALAYVACQLVFAILGVLVAHAMFDQPVFQVSAHLRTGLGQWVSEAVATFGLVTTILFCRQAGANVAYAVGLYITAAYWFTASTSFANPAVTIARSLTSTFSGIYPSHAPGFIAAQLVGAALAALFFAVLFGGAGTSAVGRKPEIPG